MSLKQKILNEVKKIKKGEVRTYKQIAKNLKNENLSRVIGNILSKNKDPSIPCHRVIKNDLTIGGYLGSYKNSYKKLALLLKEGIIVVMPTDTIYGICTSALNKNSVEKIYKLKKRSTKKPFIILISKLKELEIFGIKPTKEELKILKKIWPAGVSCILKIKDKDKLKKFRYLHRGVNSLAFRLPKPIWLRKILEISGPLVAPSANIENLAPAKTISQAKKYFKDKVIYFDKGKLSSRPSTLITLENKKIKILRKGNIPKNILKFLRK